MTWKAPGITARLIELHALKGRAALAFGMIASRLSAEFEMHISRSAVIGRARRIGLPERLSVVRRMMQAKPTPPPQQPAPSVRRDKTPPLPPRYLTLYELQRNDCRWPYGDAAPFFFCGNPIHNGTSWCRQHHKKVYAR
jgi:GcrA cell cycle regulator